MSKSMTKRGASAPAVAVDQKRAAEFIALEWVRFRGLEEQATLSALKIGLMMEAVIEALPHGQWERWREENVAAVSRSHSYRFRALAQRFLASRKLAASDAMLLGDGQPQEFEQMAFDFLGDASLAELLHSTRLENPAKRGGTREQKRDARQTRMELDRIDARELPAEGLRLLREWALKRKLLAHLDERDLRQIHAALEDVRHAIQKAFKGAER
jgi:hypothetical protein